MSGRPESAEPRTPPILPDRSDDDTDTGWGEPDLDRDGDILRERPPHW